MMSGYLCLFGFILAVYGSSEYNFSQSFGQKYSQAIVTPLTSNVNHLEVGMPESISIKLELLNNKEGPITMQLERNKEQPEFKPVFVVRDDTDGPLTLVKENLSIEQNIGVYQSMDGLAAYTVTCDGLEYGMCKPILLGSINLNGTEFDIKPTEKEGTSGTGYLYDVYSRKKPEGDGKRCVAGENQEIAAISTTFQHKVKDGEFEGLAMRNRFRFAHYETSQQNDRSLPIHNHHNPPTVSASNFAVGLLIMVDEIIYKRFYSMTSGYNHSQRDFGAKALIRQYYAHIVNAMDLRYRNIRHPVYEIRIVVTGYLIDDNHLIDIWSDQSEAAVEDVMYKAIQWRKMMMADLPPHDHLMVFTGRDLYTKFSKDYSVTGFASLESVCRHDSLSIIEDKGGFDCIITATHELGHSLGARHDGDRNICTPHDKYIMTSIGGDVTMQTRLNPFRFSECSKSYFLDRLQTLSNQGYNCMSIRKSYYDPREFAGLTSVTTGQVFGPNQQCQMKLGDDSYYGWGGNLGSFNDICTHMACKTNKTATSYNLYNAARGTSCGYKKWCIDGECVHDNEAPAREEHCVHGDSLRSFAAYRSCSHMVASDPSKCMDNYYRQFCCESCKQYGLNTFSLSGVNPVQHRAQIMSIPVTHHMTRVLPNSFSARSAQGDVESRHPQVQTDFQQPYPMFSSSQVNIRDFNQPHQIHKHAGTNTNEFRVFAVSNSIGMDPSRTYRTDHTVRPRHFYHGDQEYQAQSHVTNAVNSISHHNQINSLQPASINAHDLTSFRNLILRTLQLLARTNTNDYNSPADTYINNEQTGQGYYDSPGVSGQGYYDSPGGFFHMHDIQRNIDEQTSPIPTESNVTSSLKSKLGFTVSADVKTPTPKTLPKHLPIVNQIPITGTDVTLGITSNPPEVTTMPVISNPPEVTTMPVIAVGL